MDGPELRQDLRDRLLRLLADELAGASAAALAAGVAPEDLARSLSDRRRALDRSGSTVSAGPPEAAIIERSGRGTQGTADRFGDARVAGGGERRRNDGARPPRA